MRAAAVSNRLLLLASSCLLLRLWLLLGECPLTVSPFSSSNALLLAPSRPPLRSTEEAGHPGPTPKPAAAASSSSFVPFPFVTRHSARRGDDDMGDISDLDDASASSSSPSIAHAARAAALSAALLLGGALSGFVLPPEATAADQAVVVGALKGSGLVFKDTLQIERFEDPKIKGVVLYISNFERPLTEKIGNGNFFNDPSYASVACARTSGPTAVADNIAKGTQGEEVFEESRSLLFKTLRVQRIYDEDKKTAVYVSYNTRLDKGDDSNKSRFKSSLCAVNLE